MNDVDVQFEEPGFETQISRDVYTSWIDEIFNELKLTGSSISLFFSGEQTIRELNLQYLQKDYVTDVLSFSQVEGEEITGSSFLGDIVICVPYALDQANRMGHSLDNELKYLILHGVLHLLGYDHDDHEQGEMSTLEKDIFKKLTGEILD